MSSKLFLKKESRNLNIRELNTEHSFLWRALESINAYKNKGMKHPYYSEEQEKLFRKRVYLNSERELYIELFEED